MRARVVSDRRWQALVASLAMMAASGVLLGVTQLGGLWDLLTGTPEAPEGFLDKVTQAFLLTALLPWLLLFVRARGARELVARQGVVTVGTTTLRAEDVTGVSVAPDGNAPSIARRSSTRSTSTSRGA